jgi:hypothetical protein
VRTDPRFPGKHESHRTMRSMDVDRDPPRDAVDGPPPAWALDDPAFEDRVLRAFVRDGHLVSIPARERKKLVVYRYLLDRVMPDGAPIHERELNMRIALWHPDAATIRRALVDLGFVVREAMTYRRAVPLRTGNDGASRPRGA